MSHLVSKSICYTNLLLTTHQKRGVKMLKDAGMSIILDHHGLPGVQTSDQAFAGQCTTNVQFYVRPSNFVVTRVLCMLTLSQTPYNYQRALVWTAVMTAVSHLDPDFGAVFSIQAVNEPIMDATLTPGYGDCMRASSCSSSFSSLLTRQTQSRSDSCRRCARWNTSSGSAAPTSTSTWDSERLRPSSSPSALHKTRY